MRIHALPERMKTVNKIYLFMMNSFGVQAGDLCQYIVGGDDVRNAFIFPEIRLFHGDAPGRGRFLKENAQRI